MVRARTRPVVGASGEGGAIRVLLADRRVLVRTALRHFLGGQEGIEIVAEAADCDEAMSQLVLCHAQVLVADLHLPRLGVLDLLKRLGRGTKPAVIVTSDVIDGAMACRALDSGALAFLSHGAKPGALVTAVRTVAEGKPYLGADVIAEVAYRRVNASQDPMASLSAREFEIFRLITEGQSILDVAGALSLSPRSVANYQTQIKRKLGVATTAGLVHLALRHHVIRVASGS